MTDDPKNDMTDNRYDFGDDADVMPTSDPAFDAWIAKMAPTLNAPPKGVPRLEMWHAIQAARATAVDAQAGRLTGVIPIRRRSWRLMSVIAAALLLGVAIDRVVVTRAERRRAAVAVAPTPSDTPDPARLYRIAAAQTLTQAEALLTAFRAQERNTVTSRQLESWGRQVLSSTRLLMDSPAGDDPQLHALFNDLELVLVQIIQLSGGQLDPSERALIEGALKSKDLLSRIRTAVPAGVTVAVGSASDD